MVKVWRNFTYRISSLDPSVNIFSSIEFNMNRYGKYDHRYIAKLLFFAERYTIIMWSKHWCLFSFRFGLPQVLGTTGKSRKWNSHGPWRFSGGNRSEGKRIEGWVWDKTVPQISNYGWKKFISSYLSHPYVVWKIFYISPSVAYSKYRL